jgi:hypothetical protein
VTSRSRVSLAQRPATATTQRARIRHQPSLFEQPSYRQLEDQDSILVMPCVLQSTRGNSHLAGCHNLFVHHNWVTHQTGQIVPIYLSYLYPTLSWILNDGLC